MALIHSFETEGNYLFRYRGQIPVLLFIIAVPVIYFTGYASQPNWYQTLLGAKAIFVSILGFMVRAYTIGTTPKGTSGRNTKEQVAEQLNHSGIYSMLRHPLYLGNYLMWIGIVIYTYNIAFVAIVSLAYWLYYERIMFAEERFLERKFGRQYLDWSMKVPAFIPYLKKYIPSSVPFSFKSVLRREYSGVLATVFGFWFVDIVRIYFISHEWKPNLIISIALLISALLALILRTLKHHSSVLNEDGRS